MLLLTNDGSSSASWSCRARRSSASIAPRAFGTVTQDQLERLAEGVTIDGMRYGSIIANLERRTGRNCWIEMSLTEGKNREVRNVPVTSPAVSRLNPHGLWPARRVGQGAGRRRRSEPGGAGRMRRPLSEDAPPLRSNGEGDRP